MFIIKSDGKTVAICEQPWFIKIKAETGCFVAAAEAEAQGVSANSVPYNLPGHDEILIDGEVAPEAEVISVDMLDYIKGLEETNAVLEDTICELDSSTDERITNAEDSICELDILVSELTKGGEA